MFKHYRHLKQRGILSINARNAELILPYNQRRLYPLVDDKLKTKKHAIAQGIAVPKLYAVFETEHELKSINQVLSPYNDFVIKPAHGAGGDGILVMSGRIKHYYRQINGNLISKEELHYHLSQTLSGAFSLGGHPDSVFVEQRVITDNVFKEISYEGVPDIRIIVFKGFPIMAMLRLPTRLSKGKANLHQGAIGSGISIQRGETKDGVFFNEIIDVHPDTQNKLSGIAIPYWSKMLDIAARSYELTGLGYLGVDLVLDITHGPMMLELNARPGLNIQIANQDGLMRRVKKIEAMGIKSSQLSLSERIQFCKENF